ncbi:hypothetical protein RFI_15592, partial [Reticulomyxa filosa]
GGGGGGSVSVGVGEENLNEAKRIHAARCMRYLIRLLWTKQVKEAKELLTMAFKCSDTNRFAHFLRDPTKEPLDWHDFDIPYCLDQLKHFQNLVVFKQRDIVQLLQHFETCQFRIGQVLLLLTNHNVSQAINDLTLLRQNLTHQIDTIRSGYDEDDEVPDLPLPSSFSSYPTTSVPGAPSAPGFISNWDRRSSNSSQRNSRGPGAILAGTHRLKNTRSGNAATASLGGAGTGNGGITAAALSSNGGGNNNNNNNNTNNKRHSIRSSSSARSADSQDYSSHLLEMQRRMVAQMCEKMAKVQKNSNGWIDSTNENTQLFDSVLKTLTQLNER